MITKGVTMQEIVTYFATITPKPQHYEAAKTAVKNILEQTRAEDGCLRFDFFTDQEKKCLYLFESWRDEEAFTFHHQQVYTQDVFKAYENWLTATPELTTLTELLLPEVI